MALRHRRAGPPEQREGPLRVVGLDLDLDGFLGGLHDTGFDGWVVIEQSVSEVSPAESARINAEFVRGLDYEPGWTG